MAEEEVSPELERVLRTALTVAGQLAERFARARAEQDRARHAATADERREAERSAARQVEAGRAVYGRVRDARMWDQPNAQRLLGEALVVSDAMRDLDPLAVAAHQYVRSEARRRHGRDADAWLATAAQSYLEEVRERGDVDDARREEEDVAARPGASVTEAGRPAAKGDQETSAGDLGEGPLERQATQEAGGSADQGRSANPPGAAGGERVIVAQGFPVAASEDHALAGKSRPARASAAPGRTRTAQRSKPQERGR